MINTNKTILFLLLLLISQYFFFEWILKNFEKINKYQAYIYNFLNNFFRKLLGGMRFSLGDLLYLVFFSLLSITYCGDSNLIITIKEFKMNLYLYIPTLYFY